MMTMQDQTGTLDKYAAIKPWREEMQRLVALYGAFSEESRFLLSNEPWVDLGGEG